MINKLLSRFVLPLFVLSMYAFIYIPIVVLVLFSFNSVAFPYRWVSFSWKWYQMLLESPEIWLAFKHSLIVATSAVTLSLIMGLFIVFYSMYSKIKDLLYLFYINLMIPEIVLAVGLLSFFILFSVPLGLTTLIAGHTLLGLGYVVYRMVNGLSVILLLLSSLFVLLFVSLRLRVRIF